MHFSVFTYIRRELETCIKYETAPERERAKSLNPGRWLGEGTGEERLTRRRVVCRRLLDAHVLSEMLKSRS